MNKTEFLEKLENELKKSRYKEISDIIEYYSELIDDKVDSGRKEVDVIKELNIKDILKSVDIDQKLDIATEKPTISNGLKALIAVLSVLSLPFLIPFAVVIITFIFTAIILLFSFMAVIGALVLSAIAMIVALFVALFTQGLPFGTFMVGLGASLVMVGLFLLLSKWVYSLIKKIIVSFIGSLKRRVEKKRGKRNE